MKKTTKLEKLMNAHENVTLRKLALTTGVTYGLLLKAARKPIEGQPYDPCATNYGAVEKFFERRAIDFTELDWDQMNVASAHSREGAVSKSMDSYTVGSEWYLRENNSTPFEVVYKTETHVVVMQKETTEPRAMSFSTFLSKGPMAKPRVEE